MKDPNDSSTTTEPQFFEKLSLASLEKLPNADEVSATDVVAAASKHPQPFFVVLDDDPTGTQSVSDLPVVTSWTVGDFDWAISTGLDAVYVMTNSRSLSAEVAQKINREVVMAASKAGAKAGRQITFVSRSDSTLRGHFPLEPDTIAECLAEVGTGTDAVIVVPAFPDAGRITVDGVHYAGSVAEGFVPVAETEFAKDATFGYRNSKLSDWVAEKSAGQIPASQVVQISVKTLRTDLDQVVDQLMATVDAESKVVVCDAVCLNDLRLLAMALITAEAKGAKFIYRVGPPFMMARLGQEEKAPLTPAEINQVRGNCGELSNGGLIVIGSHVSVTTRQLAKLKQKLNPVHLEVSVAKVINPLTRSEEINRVIKLALSSLESTKPTVIATSRELVKGTNADDSLRIAREVSSSLIEITNQILTQTKPRYVVAKGGITSSDIATHGLQIRHAKVIGPLQKGIISLWIADSGPAAAIPYVVFAGNVGNDDSLADVVAKLSQ